MHLLSALFISSVSCSVHIYLIAHKVYKNAFPCSTISDDLPVGYPVILHQFDVWHWIKVGYSMCTMVLVIYILLSKIN